MCVCILGASIINFNSQIENLNAINNFIIIAIVLAFLNKLVHREQPKSKVPSRHQLIWSYYQQRGWTPSRIQPASCSDYRLQIPPQPNNFELKNISIIREFTRTRIGIEVTFVGAFKVNLISRGQSLIPVLMLLVADMPREFLENIRSFWHNPAYTLESNLRDDSRVLILLRLNS